MSTKFYSPGMDNCPAGMYEEVGANGKSIQSARTIEISMGDRLPPTQQSGNKWIKIQ